MRQDRIIKALKLAIQALEAKPSFAFGNRMTSAKVIYQLKETVNELENKNGIKT